MLIEFARCISVASDSVMKQVYPVKVSSMGAPTPMAWLMVWAYDEIGSSMLIPRRRDIGKGGGRCLTAIS